MTARASCFRLLTHCERRAASRAAWTAGSNRAIRTAMIAITTSSSIKVKPRLAFFIATCSWERRRRIRWGEAVEFPGEADGGARAGSTLAEGVLQDRRGVV